MLQVDGAPLSAEGDYICTATGKNGVAEKTITVVMESKGSTIRILWLGGDRMIFSGLIVCFI